MSFTALNSNSKITPGHLKKTAYLYIRQSTLRQVFENTESTQRQYALRQRAIVLGWPAEHIEVIDCDQGQSGASTAEGRAHSERPAISPDLSRGSRKGISFAFQTVR